MLLIIEDDPAFARILHDLAHELEFQCLIATTAEDGLAARRQYLPSAIVLDVGLPDHSGLSVLDRLKRDVAHAPHSRPRRFGRGLRPTGAVAGRGRLLLKPVKRDELIAVLQPLDAKVSQPRRRVLIVEDDAGAARRPCTRCSAPTTWKRWAPRPRPNALPC